jgi:hypothetical protein
MPLLQMTLPTRTMVEPAEPFIPRSEHAAGGESPRPRSVEKEAEAALGLPPGVHSYALLPIGYPMGRFGPVRRVPLTDVVYEDRCGGPYRDL